MFGWFYGRFHRSQQEAPFIYPTLRWDQEVSHWDGTKLTKGNLVKAQEIRQKLALADAYKYTMMLSDISPFYSYERKRIEPLNDGSDRYRIFQAGEDLKAGDAIDSDGSKI